MLLIYAPTLSARLRYTAKVVFTSCIQASYTLTDSEAEFNAHSGPKLSYSKQAIGNNPFIWAEGLMDEKTLREQKPAQGPDTDGLPTLFATNAPAILPFDVFSAIFYLISRYEEYLPHERDQHDRFIPTESIQYQYGFLNRPVVNHWALLLAQKIKAAYPAFEYTKHTFEFLSTIDVDNAWAFAHKGLLRGAAGITNDLLEFNFTRLGNRLKSWGNDANDPYNTYHIIEGIAKQYKHKLQWFFIIGDHGYNDKNPDWENRAFQHLIKRIGDKYHVGLHPSYASYRHVDKVHEERERLIEVLGRPVRQARHHFLRLKFPDTYRVLKYCEIRHDYTMAHSPLPGFRAGICTAFYWYDLPREEETPLVLHPSTVMEGTLRDYMKLSPQQGLATITKLMNEVKAVGGTFISIWHNDSFTPENHEWTKVYEEMVKLGVE